MLACSGVTRSIALSETLLEQEDYIWIRFVFIKKFETLFFK